MMNLRKETSLRKECKVRKKRVNGWHFKYVYTHPYSGEYIITLYDQFGFKIICYAHECYTYPIIKLYTKLVNICTNTVDFAGIIPTF